MPCNSEIVVTVDLGANVDTGLLMQALQKIGANPQRHDGAVLFNVDGAAGYFAANALTLRVALDSAREKKTVNKIKAAYSYEVVMSAVRRVGASALSDTTNGANVVHVRLKEI